MTQFKAEDFERAHDYLIERRKMLPTTWADNLQLNSLYIEALRLAASDMRMQERIVAWLRDRAQKYEGGGWAKDESGPLKAAADAIESGAHINQPGKGGEDA